jgi:Peptide-N-glycosidase F, C terminal/Peptide-N-glycosidase F, N terminal
VCAFAGCLTLRLASDPTTNDFSGAAWTTPYATKTWGTYSGSLLQAGSLRLTYAPSQTAVVMFQRTATGPHRSINADFSFFTSTGADGFSFNLLDTANYGTGGLGTLGTSSAPPTNFEEPVLANALSVGFDIYDPDDYQNLGAHEVSLHWNGVEMAKKLCPFDFRTSAWEQIHAAVDFVPGGAEVTVTVGGAAVYTREFIAGPTPFEVRAAFAARTGAQFFTSRLDNVRVAFDDPYVAFAPPATVRLFDHVWINGGNRTPQRSTALPPAARPWERVILRLQLDKPPNGFDLYDRGMNLSLTAGGQNYEIARFITPFGQGGIWFADVTDFQPLLKGAVQFTAFIDTYVPQAGGQYGSGWLYTADLLFCAGEPDWEAYQVQNLWNGQPRYGDPSSPISAFFTAKNPVVGAAAGRAAVRLMVTGHGQAPNTDNAAEFLVRGRTLKVGTTPLVNQLWRNDCYLNPNRPQPGTWQYSRAGWCPGARVDPWEVDISALVVPGHAVNLTYTADPYTDTTIDQGNPARHWVASQLISYRAVAPPAAPLLGVRALSNAIQLHWPSWAHLHELYFSPVLDSVSSHWLRVAQTPVVQGEEFVVTLPPPVSGGFYALQAVSNP